MSQYEGNGKESASASPAPGLGDPEAKREHSDTDTGKETPTNTEGRSNGESLKPTRIIAHGDPVCQEENSSSGRISSGKRTVRRTKSLPHVNSRNGAKPKAKQPQGPYIEVEIPTFITIDDKLYEYQESQGFFCERKDRSSGPSESPCKRRWRMPAKGFPGRHDSPAPWSWFELDEEQLKELETLCFYQVGPKDLATHFNVSINNCESASIIK